MLNLFLRAAAIAMMVTTVSFAAKAHTEDNLQHEKKIVSQNVDSMMKYKARTGNFLDKSIEGETGLLGGHIEATARFMDHNGGVCTVTVNKELLFLGYPGDFKISKRCKLSAKKKSTA